MSENKSARPRISEQDCEKKEERRANYEREGSRRVRVREGRVKFFFFFLSNFT